MYIGIGSKGCELEEGELARASRLPGILSCMGSSYRIDLGSGPDVVVVDDAIERLANDHVIALHRHESKYAKAWFLIACSCGEFEEELWRWSSRATEKDPQGIKAATERHRRVLAGEKGIYACGCTVEEGAGNTSGRIYEAWEKKPRARRKCPRHDQPYISKSDPAKRKPAMASSEVLDRLANDYANYGANKQWVFMRELRLGTGYGSREYDLQAHEFIDHGWEQRLDAFALNCWPSKKFLRIAFEVKVTRGDFLGEIKSPGKRAAALRMSNQFYFVTPEGLVDPSEIPPECGLIEIKPSGGRRTVVKAPMRECAQELPIRFVAALARHLDSRD